MSQAEASNKKPLSGLSQSRWQKFVNNAARKAKNYKKGEARAKVFIQNLENQLNFEYDWDAISASTSSQDGLGMYSQNAIRPGNNITSLSAFRVEGSFQFSATVTGSRGWIQGD